MTLGLTQPLTQMSIRKCFCGVECGWRIRMTTSPPYVSRMSRQRGILDILQRYRHPRLCYGALPLTAFLVNVSKFLP
jgi:hypothetical protein